MRERKGEENDVIRVKWKLFYVGVSLYCLCGVHGIFVWLQKAREPFRRQGEGQVNFIFRHICLAAL